MSIPLEIDLITLIPKELSPEITLGEEIPTSGAHSRIYEASIDGERYIAKVIPIDSTYDRPGCYTNEDLVRNELLISRLMGRINVGPRIHAMALGRYDATLVMDKYDGSLADLLLRSQDDKNIPINIILETVRSLIESMHRAGVIHRDLIPTNILYTKEGVIAIADYGLAIQSTLPQLREDDWKFYQAIVQFVKSGKRVEDIYEVIGEASPENVEPLTFSWRGQDCSDWQ